MRAEKRRAGRRIRKRRRQLRRIVAGSEAAFKRLERAFRQLGGVSSRGRSFTEQQRLKMQFEQGARPGFSSHK